MQAGLIETLGVPQERKEEVVGQQAAEARPVTGTKRKSVVDPAPAEPKETRTEEGFRSSVSIRHKISLEYILN